MEKTTPIGILLIGHAPLPSALLACACHVFGSDPGGVAALDVPPEGDPAQLAGAARQAVAALDAGRGVLVLTDLFGATPSNIAVQLANAPHVEVLTGMSLPMLLRALTYRGSLSLEVLVEKATAGALAGVMKIASTAPQNQTQVPGVGPSTSTTPSQDGAANALARLRDQQ